MLKCIEYLLIVASCWSLTYGRVNSQIGDVHFTINESEWLCGKLMCPPGTNYCSVKKETNPEIQTQLIRTDACHNKNHEVLNEVVEHEPKGPNDIVPVYMIATQYNTIFSSYKISRERIHNGHDHGSFAPTTSLPRTPVDD